MAESAIKSLFIEILKEKQIESSSEKARYLGISEIKFKEYFVEDPEKDLTPTIATRVLNSIMEKSKKENDDKIQLDIKEQVAQGFIDAFKKVLGKEYLQKLNFDEDTKSELLTAKFESFKKYCYKIIIEFDAFQKKEKKSMISNMVKNIYSFEKIFPERVEKTVWRIYKRADKTEDPGIKEKLSNRKGIYLLYDSSARLIYVGKTEKQDLYDEICQRLRTKEVPLLLGTKKENKLLGDMSSFLTAYEIEEVSFIPVLEHILIGLDPNTNSNIKMEKMPKK